MANERDDFTASTRDLLSRRAGMRCSCPRCGQATAGPAALDTAAVNIGVAAHITAAAKNGPRFDPTLSPEQRRSAENGIWLCQNHAKLIDSDAHAHTIEVLREWKSLRESRARDELLGIALPVTDENQDLIRTPRLAWMAGMAYNACFQTAAEGDRGSSNFRGLLLQAQPLLERLGIAIALNEEMTRPDFVSDRAMPLSFRLTSELQAIHGVIVSSAFSLGMHIGPTTGMLGRYCTQLEFRRNIVTQGVSLDGLSAAVDQPLEHLAPVLGRDLIDSWAAIKSDLAKDPAPARTPGAILEWRNRVREVLTY